MIVGFTGTQVGMSKSQLGLLRHVFLGVDPVDEVHHGDCVGADEELDAYVRTLGGVLIVIHPPSNPSKRAFCFQPGDVQRPERPYLDRNRDIVDACDVLVAAPRTDQEELRSGTWSTVRYARSVGRRVVVLPR